MSTQHLGRIGEQSVRKYLEDKGWHFVAQNVRIGKDELDLIMMDGETLVFVEVKLRKSARFAQAMEYVDRHKQDRLRITASMYLSKSPTTLQPRFDVVEIYAPAGPATEKPEIYHLEDAFQ